MAFLLGLSLIRAALVPWALLMCSVEREGGTHWADLCNRASYSTPCPLVPPGKQATAGFMRVHQLTLGLGHSKFKRRQGPLVPARAGPQEAPPYPLARGKAGIHFLPQPGSWSRRCSSEAAACTRRGDRTGGWLLLAQHTRRQDVSPKLSP